MQNMRTIREQCGLSAKQVAEQIGISRISVWNYENGKRTPNIDKLQRFAKLYGCTVDDFIKETTEEN